MFFDFGDGFRKFFRLLRDIFVGHHQVRHDEHFAHHERILAQRFRQRQNLANHQRRTRQRLAHRRLSALDALGELDLALARQQRNRSHLAQIHAHGIVGLVDELLGQLQVAGLFALFQLFVEVDLRLFENLDARAVELGQNFVELAPARIPFGQQFIDLVVENVALLFSGVHELLQPAEFFFKCHLTPMTRAVIPSPAFSRGCQGQFHSVYNTGHAQFAAAALDFFLQMS